MENSEKCDLPQTAANAAHTGALRPAAKCFVTFDRAKVTKARRSAGTAFPPLDGHTLEAPGYRKRNKRAD